MLKRAIDITVAGAALVVLFPLFVVFAVLIRLDSKGPALFRQVRMGRNFRTFKILKMRTMRDGEQGSAITLGSDPRITRMGAWLRRWKLDEFPQLWNVLRGEMSLVGPRPVIPELAGEFVADYEHLLTGQTGAYRSGIGSVLPRNRDAFACARSAEILQDRIDSGETAPLARVPPECHDRE